MGPLLAVPPDKGVEARLLLQDVRRGRLGRFLFERQLHPLVATVLLGMAGFDPLDLNPQAEPPDRQLAHAVQRVGRGKGHAVVGWDRLRQPELLKCALKDRERIALFGRREGLTRERWRLAKSVIVSG